MSAFADASALVKLYVDEEGHEAVRSLADLVVAQLARVEVPAALWRKQRLGDITVDEAWLLALDFKADYSGSNATPPRFAVVRVSSELLDEAARLAAVHGLRAYDAVQLASACAARGADPECTSFAVFDGLLRSAAATEGFRLFPSDRD